MESVLGNRYLGLALAAVLLIAAAGATSAQFTSPAPGADLEPVGGAETVIDLVQSNETILWKSLEGTVATYSILGWPSTDGVNRLGGSLVVERSENGTAGVISTSEKPKSLEFSIGD